MKTFLPLRMMFSITFFLFFMVLSAAEAGTPEPEILFDEGHGMRFLIGKDGPLDLSGLAKIMRDSGAKVASTRERLTKKILTGKKAVVISGPFQDYTGGEIIAMVNFLLNGGRCAIMLHIPNPASFLLQRLNILVSEGIVHEREQTIGDNDRDFFVSSLAPHPINEGIKRFAVYGAWALKNDGPNVAILGSTGPEAWVDLDRDGTKDLSDPSQSFAIMVAGRLGKGEYLVFGDDAIFQNRFLVDDNRRLAEKLAIWLLQ